MIIIVLVYIQKADHRGIVFTAPAPQGMPWPSLRGGRATLPLPCLSNTKTKTKTPKFIYTNDHFAKTGSGQT
jgi:hypothetical protein